MYLKVANYNNANLNVFNQVRQSIATEVPEKVNCIVMFHVIYLGKMIIFIRLRSWKTKFKDRIRRIRIILYNSIFSSV